MSKNQNSRSGSGPNKPVAPPRATQGTGEPSPTTTTSHLAPSVSGVTKVTTTDGTGTGDGLATNGVIESAKPSKLHQSKVVRAMTTIGEHTAIGLTALVSIKLLEWAMHLCWADPEHKMLFGLVPLYWVFQAGELAMLAVFLFYGTMDACKVFKEDK